MKYHIWTEGCQMNVADSQRVGSSLEHLGYTLTETIEEADVIVLNTCVVRQSAEEKAMGRVTSLAPLKKKNPNLIINLMGCMVGVRGNTPLQKAFPFVDVFMAPSEPRPMVDYLLQREGRRIAELETQHRFALQDGEAGPAALKLPAHARLRRHPPGAQAPGRHPAVAVGRVRRQQ